MQDAGRLDEFYRDTSTRRIRIRRAVTGVAVAVVLTGSVAGTVAGARWLGLAHDPPAPADSATPSGSASPSGAPATIPDSAFLQKADSVDGDHTYGDADPALMLPSLCGAGFASDSAIRQRRGSVVFYWKPGTRAAGYTPEGTFRQTITTYQPGRADDVIGQVRTAVGACPTERRFGNTYHNTILEAPQRGDESVLLQVTYPMTDNEDRPTGDTEIRLVWIVRVGDAVMILYEAGYERGWSADRATVDSYATRAVDRLRAWLR